MSTYMINDRAERSQTLDIIDAADRIVSDLEWLALNDDQTHVGIGQIRTIKRALFKAYELAKAPDSFSLSASAQSASLDRYFGDYSPTSVVADLIKIRDLADDDRQAQMEAGVTL